MAKIFGSPFARLAFDREGRVEDPAQAETIRRMLAVEGVTDLVVVSHGWKNDWADAHHLYATLWGNVVPALRTRRSEAVVVVGVEWPAKAFQTDFDTAALRVERDGGQVSAVGAAGYPRHDRSAAQLQTAIEENKAFLGEPGKAIAAAASAFVQDGVLDMSKASALFAAARGLFPVAAVADREIATNIEPLGTENPHERLLALVSPPKLKIGPGVGAACGLGGAIGEAFAGPRAAVARFLNQLTYFEMKNRAGVVGRSLGAKGLASFAIPKAVRLHLIGHSFGARLVTAAASAMPDTAPLYSLTLLQGAFSHNAMAGLVQPNVPGDFANVVGRPTGPIAMTHTHNDEACTFWYAVASRLSRDMAKDIGDRNDMFGAMGANGAQKLAAEALAPDIADQNFRPVPGKVNRFLADNYIVKTNEIDAHNNVTNPAVGRLVASVLDSAMP